MMNYSPVDFSPLLGLSGFSDNLLNNHFALYQGYVKNVNKMAELSEKAESGSPEYAELKRRFGWEYNGMVLHELYFGNLTKNASPLSGDGDLKKKIIERFGSFEAFEKDFRATGAMRGIGWVILYYYKEDGRLFNVWINEHDVGHLAGAKPLLVMDVFEHSFMLDYGLNRAGYIDAFMKAINWAEVNRRMT